MKPGYGTTPSKEITFAFVSFAIATNLLRKYLSHLLLGIHPRFFPGMYSHGTPIKSGISATPPATETIIGFAIFLSSTATAEARAR